METLLQQLMHLTRLDKSKVEPIMSYMKPIKVPAKKTLLKPDAISNTVWFVGNGVLRAYHTIQEEKRMSELKSGEFLEREITSWIVAEGGFLTDIRSFLHQTPATSYIETLEPSKLYRLCFEDYLSIHRAHPDIARVLFENTMIMADLRVKMCCFRNPMNRLRMFEKMYPGMSGRISVALQASYLNVDPATLSRLRGKAMMEASASDMPITSS
ncbi:CRP-like cAMP-binding protein [Dyadobacter jejuensis]|uniref:CRP-like cAMP-binding protein n=1 Tax=Dyadobacter jejuensis TaxID=1082580 RepID=A0A316AHG2_9BACT|nr:Crp/Fnr family transcriptional regulator [Dyadobacter jejuensis]PWJ57175.1 CRP-like cAMP-binding protein [Dyadobacter jejuensis]